MNRPLHFNSIVSKLTSLATEIELRGTLNLLDLHLLADNFYQHICIPCLHFLLNGMNELMHDNQLLKIAHLVNSKGIQFVASILKDKLPEELNREEYFVVKLSQGDKLFRIE